MRAAELQADLDLGLIPIAFRSKDTTHVTTLASKLRELNDKVNSIKLEQQYQREVEATFRDASEKTNSRAVWWILAQMVVLGGMALWQNRHLKVSARSLSVCQVLVLTRCCRSTLETKKYDDTPCNTSYM